MAIPSPISRPLRWHLQYLMMYAHAISTMYYTNVPTYDPIAQVERTLDTASLAVIMFNFLLLDTARSIFFPTLWPRIESFGGDNVTLGYCVGALSLGRYVPNVSIERD